MFEAKDMTLGQANALAKKLGGMEIVMAILAGKVKFTVEQVQKAVRSMLAFRGNIRVASGEFVPKKWFVDRNGLFIWDDFKDRILSATDKISEALGRELSYYDLRENAYDREIQAELPEGYLFEDPSIFCAYLADLIIRQALGNDGILLNNGYANIFYVRGRNGEVFMVRVRWLSARNLWCVDSWRLDCRQWVAGIRAFSAAASQPAPSY